MTRGKTLATLAVFGCIMLIPAFMIPRDAQAATKKEINASVDVALDRFVKDVKGGQEFLNAAKGVLVIPRVVQAGFIVGGKYGDGALRIGGKSVGYYNLTAGSVGLQIGAQQSNVLLCFMDEAALRKFRASKGWQVGVDGSVALVTVGAGGSVDTTKLKEPIVGFVYGQQGLMADISLEGLKFTRITPN
ncbi:MAG TPA: YSC84-related protein [Syntrophobacteria bacterium]|nr:YSC84-related protein [Syntrophobacteria bacterium]